MARTKGSYCTATQAPGLQQAWQSMRVLQRFTTADLLMTAAVGESAALKYCRALAGAGYLRQARGRVRGRAGSRHIWQLVRDSGPMAPIRRKDGSGVYDRNLDILWPFPEPPSEAKPEGRPPDAMPRGPV